MLKNIKSLYFIRRIFSYIDEKHKLKLVKYNKSFQDIIDISLINYKFLSGKYIIYENKNGKEYKGYDNQLLFEGEYLNGKRDGKGKEYYKSDLIFEGEYLNGEKSGKGKEYYCNNKLKFEGEYLQGKRNGKGKEYYYEGKLKFEGEYFDDKKLNGIEYDETGNIIYELINGNGKVKEYFFGHIIFEGEFKNGNRNEKGKEYSFDGKLEFEGEYLNGLKWNGTEYNNGEKINEFNNGIVKVREYNNDNILIFEGERVL